MAKAYDKKFFAFGSELFDEASALCMEEAIQWFEKLPSCIELPISEMVGITGISFLTRLTDKEKKEIAVVRPFGELIQWDKESVIGF